MRENMRSRDMCNAILENDLLNSARYHCLPDVSINRPRSIYQYSSMAPRLSGQDCKFFKFLLSFNSQKRLKYKENNTKYRSLTRKPRRHVRILIYRTWPIARAKNDVSNPKKKRNNLVPRSLVDEAEGKIWPNAICTT